MMPTICNEPAPIPSPSYHRREAQAQAQRTRALHVNALTLIETLYLLALCRLAVHLAHRRCPPPLPKGPGGVPRTCREESLLLIALLKTRLPALLSPIKTCMTGWEAGLPWRWPVACRREPMECHAFPVLPNCVSEGLQQERHPLKPSSSSPSGGPCASV
jgi:hypothetical protein